MPYGYKQSCISRTPYPPITGAQNSDPSPQILVGMWKNFIIDFAFRHANQKRLPAPDLDKLLLSLCLHGCEKVMGTRTEFHFGWVYAFFIRLSSLRNWRTPTRETSCNPAPPAQLCGSSGKHLSSSTVLLVIQ